MASDMKQASRSEAPPGVAPGSALGDSLGDRSSRRIVMPGGGGHVGELLAQYFHGRGDKVIVLSRNPERQPRRPWTVLPWDPAKDGEWIDALDGADACIGLSGRSVNTRATAKHRAEIYHSRVDTTTRLGVVMRRLRHTPPVWLNASTATIYRHALDRPQDEFSGEEGGHEPGVPASWAFSVTVGRDWEAAMFTPAMPQTRRVALRTSLVMSAQPGSIFAVLSRLVRLGLGGTNGKGNQRVSWMHATDFVRAVEWLLNDERRGGVVNLCAPTAPQNVDFMRTLRQAWGVRFGPPAPEWAIRLGTFLMRTESELVLKSRWVYPGRLVREGFSFEFPEWKAAAEDLVRQMRANAAAK